MRRDDCDFSMVRPLHEAIHADLVNWARWCRGQGGSAPTHPMFIGYRNGYEEMAPTGTCDTLGALATQKLFIQLPEKHRWAINWWYCKPFIPVMRVRKALGLTTPALYELIHEARTIMKNRRRHDE